MSVSWTEEQQQVIDLRDCNILVSAAAGSGKTAVLVERIIGMITDPEHPMDIDRLLVVTFTNAAAAEMKERVRQAIDKRLLAEPGNGHLKKQQTLIHSAMITTIHSFCLRVMEDYFYLIDLEPGYRIADEGEVKLLKADVLEQLLEDCYQEKDEDFLYFTECYSPGKTDGGIEEIILQLFHFAQSYPDMEKWLTGCRADYQVGDWKAIEETGWMKCLLEDVRRILADLRDAVGQGIAVCAEEDGPHMYREALEADLELLAELSGCKTYGELHQALSGKLAFAKLSSKRDAAVSQIKRDQVKELRSGVKDALKKLQKQYFYAPPEELLEDLKGSSRLIGVLVELVLAFDQRYRRKKQEKNLVDFNDLEHFALQILVDRETGEATEAARAYRSFYREIMIDEYQDSNLIQELLLAGISGEQDGVYNRFMVGDVKQSIYRFRLARPQLFMEKFDSYSTTEGNRRRIDLHKNFRSRSQVLDSVNYICSRIMARYLGNVEYDEKAALYPGADFPDEINPGEADAELLLIDVDFDEETEEADYTARELEAKAVAEKIKQLTLSGQVIDKETGAYRPVMYKDIAILLRTLSGWGDTFVNILADEGIPSYTSSKTGYFYTWEIRIILDMLRVLDNPLQDIPLAAVLKSPIGGFSAEDLAQIRCIRKEGYFFESCREYLEAGENPELAGRLQVFYQTVESFRERVPYTPIHELLFQVLDETGFMDYLTAMPAGEQRRANADMLLEKAIAFESASYRGLFNFIRYIEYLQKYNVDFGEAGIHNENENAVQIVSIHKSKGLEYPVVIAAGMGKTFNTTDSRSKLILHPDIGIGTDFIDPVLRLKAPTLLKKTIQRQTALENLGEELRVLYVALTRAKEKLIMTGAVKKLAEKLGKWSQIRPGSGGKLSFRDLSGASCYLDWIVPALLGHPGAEPLRDHYQIICPSETGENLWGQARLTASVWNPELYLFKSAVSATGQVDRGTALRMLDEHQVYDEALHTYLKGLGSFAYPYQQDTLTPAKMTVSEIKKAGQYEPEETAAFPYDEPQIVPLVPAFIQKEQVPGATLKGTAYHKVLQLLDFCRDYTEEEVDLLIQGMAERGTLTQEMADSIYSRSIWQFTRSELAGRMKAAAAAGKLYKEKQFVIGKEVESGELVLVQGIIDAYFYEDESIVLIDYKTDYVKPNESRKLADRYKIQLDSYGEALEQLTGSPVAEKYIYSFGLQESIRI